MECDATSEGDMVFDIVFEFDGGVLEKEGLGRVGKRGV